MAKLKTTDLKPATKKDLEKAQGVLVEASSGNILFPFTGKNSAEVFLAALKNKGYSFFSAANPTKADFPLQIPTNVGIPTDPKAEANLAWQYYDTVGLLGTAVDTMAFLTTKVPRVKGLVAKDELRMNAWLEKVWRARAWINRIDVALRNTGTIAVAYVEDFQNKSIVTRHIKNGQIQEKIVELKVPTRIVTLNYESVDIEQGPVDSPDVRIRLPIETVRMIRAVHDKNNKSVTDKQRELVNRIDESIIEQVLADKRLIVLPSNKVLLYRRGIPDFRRHGRVWTSRAFLPVQELLDAIKQMWIARRNLLRGLIFAKVQRPGAPTPPSVLKGAIDMMTNPVNVNGMPVVVWDESLSFERVFGPEKIDIMGTEFDRITSMLIDSLEMAPLFRARNREVPRLFESMYYVSLTQEPERDVIAKGTKPLLEAVADANDMKGDPYLDWDDDPRTTDPAQLRAWTNLMFRFGIFPPEEVTRRAGVDFDQIVLSRLRAIEENHSTLFAPPIMSGPGNTNSPATPEGGRPPGTGSPIQPLG